MTPRGPSCGQLPKFPVLRPGDSFTTGRVVSVLGGEGRGLVNKVPTITQSFENMINKMYIREKISSCGYPLYHLFAALSVGESKIFVPDFL